MKRAGLMLCLLAGLTWFGGQLQAQEIEGIWQGILPGSVKERIVLTISKEDTGFLSSKFYYADHVLTFPATVTTYQASTLKCSNPEGYGYEGTMSPDGTTIKGRWRWNPSGKGTELDLERATKESNWGTDTTPHKVSFVTVEPGVKLEVLDWGGTGRPLVLLSGLGENAHVFDAFAQKLTDKYHVYGISRRGFGASDSPPPLWQNYSADRLGSDVIAVLDQLKLEHPVVAGHSIAGEELSFIGSSHPERVAGLIYLDAGYPFAMYVRSLASNFVDWDELRNKVNALTNSSTPQEGKKLIQEMLQTELPRYEQQLKETQQYLQQQSDATPPPQEKLSSSSFQIRQAIYNGEERFTTIQCPVLALFRQSVPKPASDTASAKAQAQSDIAMERNMLEGQVKAFEALGPNAHVVLLPGADHYIFRSNETDVLREMNAFITTLP